MLHFPGLQVAYLKKMRIYCTVKTSRVWWAPVPNVYHIHAVVNLHKFKHKISTLRAVFHTTDQSLVAEHFGPYAPSCAISREEFPTRFRQSSLGSYSIAFVPTLLFSIIKVGRGGGG